MVEDEPVATPTEWTPLPIVASRGLPQTFSMVFEGRTYRMTLYANIAADALETTGPFVPMPSEQAFVVLRVEREEGNGATQTIFVRKIVPGHDYAVERIRLRFEAYRVARSNLNNRGDFGTVLVGRIAPRWG